MTDMGDKEEEDFNYYIDNKETKSFLL